MKKVLFVVCLTLAGMGAGQCQQSLVGTYWHNGSYYIPVLSETDSTIATVTLSLHEGGNVEVWRKTTDLNVYMRPNQLGNAWTDTIIYFQDSIVHRTVDGQEALFIYGRERKLEDVYLRYDGRSANKWYEVSHGFDSVLESDIRCQIMGNYCSEGQGWSITSDSIFVYSLSSLPNRHLATPTPSVGVRRIRRNRYWFSVTGVTCVSR